MAMKTNKSFQKRLKVTKNGKVLVRKSGQSHFNAKERGSTKLNKRNMVTLQLSNKSKSRYLVNVK